TTTKAPSSAKRRAIARPSPDAPPVTTATRFARTPGTALAYVRAHPDRRRPAHASARRPGDRRRRGAPRRDDDARRVHEPASGGVAGRGVREGARRAAAADRRSRAAAPGGLGARAARRGAAGGARTRRRTRGEALPRILGARHAGIGSHGVRDATRLGMLVRVHCENGGAVDALVDEQLAHGSTGVEGFVRSRPPLVEEEAVERTLALARLADGPVYLVHLTTAGSIDLVRRARARGQVVWAEACTHHLVLDDACYRRDDATRFLVVPPLRARSDVDALWDAVADGTLDAIGSDHATAPFTPPGETGDFRSLPYGFRGVGARMPLVLSEGTRRGVPLER